MPIMHIVLVCREFVGSVRAGGIGSYMEEIAKEYVAMGHKVTVVTASDDTRHQSTYLRDGYTVISLSGGDFFCQGVESGSKLKKLRLLYRFHSYRRKLRKVIAGIEDVDIVEVADYGAEALYLHNIDVPVVVRLHTPLSLSLSNLNRIMPSPKDFRRYFGLKAEARIFRNAKYITSCSQSLLDWLTDNFELNPRAVAVIRNPVKTPAVDGDTVGSKGMSIFYAGTITETKGVGDLLNACRILREKGLNISLRLAGKGGSYCDRLRQELESGNADWCEFLGKLPREEVYRQYMSASVCCFPSWWENMPMVVLESMSLGAIVVSTDAGGTKEIIHDGSDGFLVPRKSPERLADALERALTLDEKQKREMKERARNEIRKNYNPRLIATQMIAFFERVIEDFKIESCE